MVNYKIIKYCIICRKRFVVNKGESKKRYCEDCVKKMQEDKDEE